MKFNRRNFTRFFLSALIIALTFSVFAFAQEDENESDSPSQEIIEEVSQEEKKPDNENSDEFIYKPQAPALIEAAAQDGKIITDDYHPEHLISTRYNRSRSGNVITWYLSYTRAGDIVETIKEIFDEEASANDIKISQNSVTNSIIVKAKEPDSPIVQEILDTIVSLDFRSGQVLIEVLVVELTVSDEDLFDFELLNIVKQPFNIKNTLTTIGVDHGTIGETNPLAKSDRFKVFVTTPNRLKMFLNAYKDKNKANVISSPHIVAANHREATFKIGNKVPIIESIRPSDAGPIKAFEIKDVGIELTVTPHINRGNQIDMEVFQAINALQSYDAKEGTANMSNREIKTNVSLADGETLILGGFIEERKIKVENKIPVLGQIPVIGKAFNKRQINEEKVELLIFITPKILDTVEDVKVATKQKVEKTSFKDRVEQLLQNNRIKRASLPENQVYFIERASRDWFYDYDRKDIEDMVWDIPTQIDPTSLKLRRSGHMPFGYGPSKRLKPPRLNTELVPSEGFIMAKEFTVDDPKKFKYVALNVASNNAAVVYINGQMVDQDPAMKLKDGHDFEYWNRSLDQIPGAILKEGANSIVVFLGNDKSASDAYLDLELIGIKHQ